MFVARLPAAPASLAISRRAASSYLTSTSSPSHQQHKQALSGRGRAKPMKGVSVASRLSAAKLSRNTDKKDLSNSSASASGRGRNIRRRLSQSHTTDGAFGYKHGHGLDSSLSLDQPIETNSLHSALHIACTPSHMPLPIPLGPEQYIRPRSSSLNPVPTPSQWLDPVLGPFDTSLPSHIGLAESIAQPWIPEGGGRNTLTDHLHVMWNLARPGRYHHLMNDNHAFDPDNSLMSMDLSRAVGEATAKNRVEADAEWNTILSKLGDRATKKEEQKGLTVAQEMNMSKEEKSEVDLAVDGLTSLMSRLSSGRQKVSKGRMIAVVGADGEEEWVRMDSTRRKRKKKINKHKYKKRRKAQRALRKKLGK